MIPITEEDLVSINKDNLIRICLETNNAEVLQHLETVGPDNWINGIHSALEVGASVLNRVAASNNVDYIEKRFNETAHNMEQFFDRFKLQLTQHLQNNFDLGSNTDGFIHKALDLILREHGTYTKQIEAMLEKAHENQQQLDRKLDPHNTAGYVSALLQQIEAFDRRLEKQFSESDTASFVGKLRHMVESHFGEDGAVLQQIQEHMSLEGDTPLAHMYAALHREILELRDQLMILKGQQEVIEKTTAKGYPFEDRVFDKLQEIARPHSDLVEDTSLKAEAITGSKKGDYLYTLSDSLLSIAVDAKNYYKLRSLRAMLEYLRTTIKQRNARLGIIVVPDRDSMQKQIGDWNFYEGDKIITTLEHLEISIKFAKFMIQSQHDADSEVNVAEIRSKLEAIQQKMRDITVIKSKLTKLSNGVANSVEELQQLLDNLKDEVNTKLGDIAIALG